MIPIRYYAMRFLLLFIFVILFWYTYRSINHFYFNLLRDMNIEKPLKRPLKSTMIYLNGTVPNFNKIKQIYTINLPYREDRRTGMIAVFQTLNINALIVPGFNIHSLETTSHLHLTWNSHFRVVELASWLSHIQIWLEVMAFQDDSWAIIFEDDIDLEVSTFDILRSFPLDLWNIPDMIYLGYCGNPPGRLIYEGIQGYRVHQALNPSCAHAYAIRRRSVEKILPLISPPRMVIDDAMCNLVNNEKILVYSIHPPLVIQQLNTSTRPSDMNPVKKTLTYKIQKGVNHLIERWRGVEFINKLKNSTLAQSDLKKANQWRIDHESEIWKINNVNNFSHNKQ